MAALYITEYSQMAMVDQAQPGTLVRTYSKGQGQAAQATPLAVAGSLAFGQWYAAVRELSVEGGTSPWSNEAPFVLAAVVPDAPLNFTAA